MRGNVYVISYIIKKTKQHISLQCFEKGIKKKGIFEKEYLTSPFPPLLESNGQIPYYFALSIQMYKQPKIYKKKGYCKNTLPNNIPIQRRLKLDDTVSMMAKSMAPFLTPWHHESFMAVGGCLYALRNTGATSWAVHLILHAMTLGDIATL